MQASIQEPLDCIDCDGVGLVYHNSTYPQHPKHASLLAWLDPLVLRALTCAAMHVTCIESCAMVYLRQMRMHAPHMTHIQRSTSGLERGGWGWGEVPHLKLIFVQCDMQESNVTRVHKGTVGSDLA